MGEGEAEEGEREGGITEVAREEIEVVTEKN